MKGTRSRKLSRIQPSLGVPGNSTEEVPLKILAMLLALIASPLAGQDQDLGTILRQAENALASGATTQAIDSVLANGINGLYFADLTDLKVAVEQPAGTPVFIGLPNARTSTNGVNPVLSVVEPDDADDFQVRIVMVDDRLYWATREYKRMISFDGPAFTRYQAWDGSGYVKALKMPADDDPVRALGTLMLLGEGGHTYVEHLVGRGISGVTYWGMQVGGGS